jgi:protein-tyrosine phosphatase
MPRIWPLTERFSICSRPRCSEDVLGLETLVSLLTREERDELGLTQESEWCRAHRVTFLELPIPDRGLPSSAQLRDLWERLPAGRVAVHCRAGIGRSAVVAAYLMVRSGWQANKALERIREARGCDVPDTEEQRDFVLRL